MYLPPVAPLPPASLPDSEVDLNAARQSFLAALKAGDAPSLSASLQALHASPVELARLLKEPSGHHRQSALRGAMANGHEASVQLLLSAAGVLRKDKAIGVEDERKLLTEAMSNEALDHPDVFAPWLQALKLAVDGGRMNAREAKQALLPTSLRYHADIRTWAGDPGKADRLRQWGTLISQAQATGLINAKEARTVLLGPYNTTLKTMLERSNKPEALAAYMDAQAIVAAKA